MDWKLWPKPSGGKPSSTTREGDDAEKFATNFLKAKGLSIIARNYRKRSGEIDIIAQHAEQLVFVEVRLRNHRQFASGAESVDARKQHKLIATADQYLQEHYGNQPPPCRFDVVSLMRKEHNGRDYEATWLQDAFRPPY